MTTTPLPYFHVNVLTGLKGCRVIEDPAEYAMLIKRARRPLFVLGARTLNTMLGDKLLMEWAVDIAKTLNLPVVATAQTKKKLVELNYPPASSYDILEIINHLKDPNWKGVKNEGNHDLVIFLGVRSDLGNQGLSTLKHFAPHLKTMTLCKYVFPHATYSLPNLRDDKWKEFLEKLIAELNVKEA